MLSFESLAALPSHPFPSQPSKQKRKFSSFFKSLVIELDKELYGPDNHLVEVSGPGAWEHRLMCQVYRETGSLPLERAKCVCLLPTPW